MIFYAQETYTLDKTTTEIIKTILTLISIEIFIWS